MTSSVDLQPHTFILPPKPVVVTSSKKMTTWDKTLEWINSPAGFKKATETLVATATLAAVAGIVYYLNQNNFFSSVDELSPEHAAFGPRGYFCDGKPCLNNDATTVSTTTVTPTTVSTTTISTMTKTTPNSSDSTLSATYPNTSKKDSNITYLPLPGDEGANVNKRDEIKKAAVNIFNSSIFCQSANDTQVTNICRGILEGRLVVDKPDTDKDFFPNLQSALTHIYKAANGPLHDVLCNATGNFWDKGSKIGLKSYTEKKFGIFSTTVPETSMPVSNLLDPSMNGYFENIYNKLIQTCGLDNSN